MPCYKSNRHLCLKNWHLTPKEFLFKDVKHVRGWLKRMVFKLLNLCAVLELSRCAQQEGLKTRLFNPQTRLKLMY